MPADLIRRGIPVSITISRLDPSRMVDVPHLGSVGAVDKAVEQAQKSEIRAGLALEKLGATYALWPGP